MLIRVLWVFCVSVPARRLHFHISARLFGMMLSSCCSVIVHFSLEVAVSPPLPPSTVRLNVPYPSLARALLCNAGLYVLLAMAQRPEAFFMRRLHFPLPKMSFNYTDCSRREVGMFFSPVSHDGGLCCCQQSLWHPVGLNFTPSVWSLEVCLWLWYILIDSG